MIATALMMLVLADDPVDRVVELLVGSFRSEAQATADPENYRDVTLHMARIWPEQEGAKYLYVEQVMTATPDRPYRQRIYRVTAKGEEILSEVFTLPDDPLRFRGAWSDPAKLGALTPADLKRRDGCEIVLKRRDDGTYAGATRGEDCPSELNGAAYATSEVVLAPDGLETWDRGYDAAGRQVWGATKGPYQFKRVK